METGAIVTMPIRGAIFAHCSFGILTTMAATAMTLATATAQSTPEATPVAETLQVKVLGVQTFPPDLMYEGTLVGGLSGIDYDPESGHWIAISDDRSDN